MPPKLCVTKNVCLLGLPTTPERVSTHSSCSGSFVLGSAGILTLTPCFSNSPLSQGCQFETGLPFHPCTITTCFLMHLLLLVCLESIKFISDAPLCGASSTTSAPYRMIRSIRLSCTTSDCFGRSSILTRLKRSPSSRGGSHGRCGHLTLLLPNPPPARSRRYNFPLR